MADVFAQGFNIDVWDPSNAALWEWRPHRANAHAYNQAWQDWLDANPSATAEVAGHAADQQLRVLGY